MRYSKYNGDLRSQAHDRHLQTRIACSISGRYFDIGSRICVLYSKLHSRYFELEIFLVKVRTSNRLHVVWVFFIEALTVFPRSLF